MTDVWTERLSAYLDGELAPEPSAALETHLAECAECAATLEELRRVVVEADDLWPGIAARLEPQGVIDLASRRPVRRFAFTVPQLVAAGVALMVISSVTVYAVLDRGPGGERAPASAAATASQVPVQFASYETTVRTLEQELELRRADMDPATVAVVEENLKIIDKAIEEARAALADDPSSSYLTTHLAQTMQRKVDLLQRATSLAGA
jgi:anti-sigma factor RsiW